MAIHVRLAPVDDQNLTSLMAVAVLEAEPEEVMAPVDGPAGWTQDRCTAFREFHRASFGGLDEYTRNQMYVICYGDAVVGMARLARLDEPATSEIGMWLGRSRRGRGVGAAALREPMRTAHHLGIRMVIAVTVQANTAALTVLIRHGARLHSEGESVIASIPLRMGSQAR